MLANRIEQMKIHTQTSTTKEQSLYKCSICSDNEVIYQFTDETKTYISSMEPCSCVKERRFKEFNPSEDFTNKELRHTFKNALIDDDNMKQFEAAISFIRNLDAHINNGTWLYVFGDELRADYLSKQVKEAQRAESLNKQVKEMSAFGTGKTFLMQCIANALAHRKQPGIFVNEERLFGDIKATYERKNVESEREVLHRYYQVPILMIDDIFSAQYTEWAEGKLFGILDERWRKKRITIFSSNYAVGRIKSRLPFNGGKISSRITGQSEFIEMVGPDRRRSIDRDYIWKRGIETE